MFWADKTVEDILRKFEKEVSDKTPLVIRDEKTASGHAHIGSMRGAAIHGVLSEVLTDRGIPNQFLWEINDFDPMDGLPVYLDEKEYRPHMGKPLYTVPSPDPVASNFAEFYGTELTNVIDGSGFHPTYYRLSVQYQKGLFNDSIRAALEHASDIRRIYKEVSGSVKPDDWYPLQVVCENCGRIGTTKVIGFDGEKVEYTCEPKMVTWAEGCGHKGKISPFDGNGKLPFKVDWAAKWKIFGVHIEGGGKDHATKGGTHDVASHICREIFNYEPPFYPSYEFFLVGGKKMSSSKGNAATAKGMSELLPPHIFRLLLIGKDPKQQINVDPSGDAIPLLFDWYDKLAEKTWSGTVDDDSRLFTLIHVPEEQATIPMRFLPRFSLVAFIIQMPHLDLLKEVERMKGSPLTDEDKKEAELRAKYARQWLDIYAPEQFKYEIQKEVPETAKHFSETQKKALRDVLEYIESHDPVDGADLHTSLHGIRKGLNLEPADFFGALYQITLGKASGPKAGWFLSVLPRDFLIERLKAVS